MRNLAETTGTTTMKRAYALARTSSGRRQRAAEKLRLIPGVLAVEPVAGAFDLIIIIEAPDVSAVARLAHTQVAAVDGVAGVTTCLVQGQCE